MTLVIVLLVLAISISAGVPVAYGLLLSGLLGLTLELGASGASSHLASIPYSTVASWSLLIIPMFIIMGMFALHADLAADLYSFFARWTGAVPGGLGVATVAACAGFAAVTGSSVATVATLGRLCIDEMARHNYPRHFAAAIVACCGTLGILIPPSVILVLFGITTGESIGSLLLAGIVPGIITAFIYAVGVMILARRLGIRSSLAKSRKVEPSGSSTNVQLDDTGPKPSYSSIVYVAAIFMVVIGGIYSGLFTALESGAIGALVALSALVLRKRRDLPRAWQGIRASVIEATSLNAMVFTVVIGASFFSMYLVVSGIPRDLTSWMLSLPVSPTLLALGLLLLLVPLGMFLEPFSIVVIAAPLMYGPITEAGMSGVWVGIMFVMLIELGVITPPIGMNVFAVAGTSPGLQVHKIFGSLGWFYVMSFAAAALVFVFPDIALWLPSQAG